MSHFQRVWDSFESPKSKTTQGFLVSTEERSSRLSTFMSEMQRLLHVEDDRLVARALARLLRPSGFELIHAVNCQEARKLDEVFALGLFDIDLPDGSGVNLARDLLEAGRVVRAVFFTASDNARALTEASRLGAVILKAEGVDRLLEVLKAVPAAAEGEAPQSEVTGRVKANAS